MSYHFLGDDDYDAGDYARESNADRKRRLQDEALSRKRSLQDEARYRRQGQEDAEQARQDATAAQASAYAHGPSRVQSVDYMKYVNQGGNFMKVPGGRGAVSRAAGGIGQGLLIFGILAGALFAMFMVFVMIKPKTPAYSPYGYKKTRKK